MWNVTTILLVDDDVDSRLLAHDAICHVRPGSDVREVRSAAEAMEFLRRRGRYASAPRPDLICLDVEMPGMSGQEVLKAMKSDPDLMCIPVVMLTAVNDENQKQEALRNGAVDYMVKPLNQDAFSQLLDKPLPRQLRLDAIGGWRCS